MARLVKSIYSDGVVTALGETNPTDTLDGPLAATITPLTDGLTITPDFGVSNNFSVTLAGNRTLANPTNMVAGQSGVIVITQNATGANTLAYGGYWKFAGGIAPSLTGAVNSTDLLTYYVESATRVAARLLTDIK